MAATRQHLHRTVATSTLAPLVVSSDPDAAFNESQAANLLGVSVRTLQAWRFRGGGPRYIKIGRAVRYQRKVLVSFQAEHTVSSITKVDAAKAGRDGLR
jgi:helix-turn-helix protein